MKTNMNHLLDILNEIKNSLSEVEKRLDNIEQKLETRYPLKDCIGKDYFYGISGKKNE